MYRYAYYVSYSIYIMCIELGLLLGCSLSVLIKQTPENDN